jgi:hypothetical protein
MTTTPWTCGGGGGGGGGGGRGGIFGRDPGGAPAAVGVRGGVEGKTSEASEEEETGLGKGRWFWCADSELGRL